MAEANLNLTITATDLSAEILDGVLARMQAIIGISSDLTATNTGLAASMDTVTDSTAGTVAAMDTATDTLASMGATAVEAGGAIAAGVTAGSEEAEVSLAGLSESAGVATDSVSGIGEALMGLMVVGAGAFGVDELTKHTMEYAESLKQLSAQTGMTYDQSAQLLAMFSDVGLDSQSATMSIMQLDKMITSMSSTTKEQLAQWHVVWQNAQGDVLPFPQLLQNIADAYQKLGSQQGTMMLTDFFGRAGPQLSELMDDFDKLNAKTADIKSPFADLDQTIAQSQDLSNDMTKISQQIAVIGAAVIPVMTSVSKGLGDVLTDLTGGGGILKAFEDWCKDIGALGTAITVAIGLFAALKTATMILAGIEAISKGITAVAAATNLLTGAQLALNVAMDANVIGLVILAVAALALGAYELITHWTQVKEFFIGLWADITNIWHTAIDDVIDYVKNNWEDLLIAALTGPFAPLTYLFEKFGPEIIQGLWNGITSAATWIQDQITGFCTDIEGWFKAALKISSPSQMTMDMGVQLSQGLAQGIINGTSYVNAAIQTQGTALSSYEKLVQTADNAINTYNQDMATNAEKYSDQVSAAMTKQSTDIQTAMAAMNSKLMDASNIFQDTESKMVNPNALTKDLQDQITQLTTFTSDIADLTKKGVDEGLIANLEQMGPKAAPEMTALNDMTSNQLTQYVQLWHDKQVAANDATTEELQNGQSEIGEKVNKIETDTATTLQKYYDDWQTANQKVLDSTTQKLADVQAQFDQMNNKATLDGQNLIKNFVSGINSEQGALQNAMEEVANITQSYLPASSPAETGPLSKLDDYGPNLVNGFVQGILDNVNKITGAMNSMLAPVQASLGSVGSIGVSGGLSVAGAAGGGGLVVQNYFQGMTIAQSQTELANLVSQAIWQKMKGVGKF